MSIIRNRLASNFVHKDNLRRDKVTGVYFLFEGDDIVYIGQSRDIHQRITNHYATKVFDSWNYIKIKPSELDIREAEYIIEYRPIYNKGLPINDIWIPQATLKREWGIGKVEMKRMIRDGEVESFTLNNRNYIKGYQHEL